MGLLTGPLHEINAHSVTRVHQLWGHAVIAHYRPIQLGKTLLLTVAIVAGIWLVLAVLFTIALKKRKREADARIESIYKARSQPQPR